MESVNIKELNERIQRESSFVDLLSMEMGKVIVGQKQLIENLLIGLLADGHILLEGVPGLAKTLAINWHKPSALNSAESSLLRTCFLRTCWEH